MGQNVAQRIPDVAALTAGFGREQFGAQAFVQCLQTWPVVPDDPRVLRQLREELTRGAVLGLIRTVQTCLLYTSPSPRD